MNPISQSLKAIFQPALELTSFLQRKGQGKWRGGRLFRFFVFFFSCENFKQKDYIYKRII